MGCKSDLPCENRVEAQTGTYRFPAYSPVYTPKSEIRTQIFQGEKRPIRGPGKLFVRGNTIFLVQPYEGVHIIDNTNPSHPRKTSFLAIPGVIDISVRVEALYADSYSDLVVFDISDLDVVVKRHVAIDVFKIYGRPMPEGGQLSRKALSVFPADHVITGWKSEGEESYTYNSAGYCFDGISETSTVAATSATQAGKAGSMSRFALSGDFLYLLSTPQILTADVRTVFSPVITKTTAQVWDGETLFPYASRLFVGGRQGMTVFDLETPALPKYISSFTHARSCDPVVVAGNNAYITLRGGTGCRVGANQLDIVDLSAITTPRLIRSYAMSEPKGLAVREPYLYLCDGSKGVVRLNIADPADVFVSGNTAAFNAFDVIVGENLIAFGTDGLYQFSAETLLLLSKLD